MKTVTLAVTGPKAGPWIVTPAGIVAKPYDLAAATYADAAAPSRKRGYPQVTGGATAAECANTITALHAGTATAKAVTALGRTLYDALLEPVWDAVRAACAAPAGTPPTDAIELALDLGDTDLVGLPWELMCDEAGFIARGVDVGGRVIDVVVTRRVARTAVSAVTLGHPLRYLFVIGDELDDTLRAGAECMGLLRQLGPRIHDRVLTLRSERRSLADVVDEFRPHLVHFICHGAPDPSGAVMLQLFDQATQAVVSTSAAELAAALIHTDAGARWCPTAVVLSACSAGTTLGVDADAGIATTLVGAGIPIVVGMAAEVSDLACRIFTRRLGAALIGGVPLALAAAQGRRAALRDPSMPADVFDWGLVNLIMGRDVDASIAVPAIDPTSSAGKLIDRVRGYSLPIDVDPVVRRQPPFVGRADVIAGFYELIAGRGPAVMCLFALPPSTTLKVGKRRTVAELAALALRAGHIPVVVMPKRSAKGVPRTVDALAQELARAVARARTVFGVVAAVSAVDAARAASADLDGLKDALERDLRALRTDITAADELVRTSRGEVVVFVHDVHLYGEAIEPWFADWLGGNGLGTAVRIPVVTSYARRAPDDKDATGNLDAAIEELVTRRERTRFATFTLGPLGGAGVTDDTPVRLAERLAYQRVLLHPFRDEPALATRPWFLDLRDSGPASKLEKALKWLRRGCGTGCPGSFDSTSFYQWVEAATEVAGGSVRAASDDDIMRGKGSS